MSLSPGQYKLTNAKSETTFDLSGGDNRSIIGYSFHDGENQKWQFEQQSDGQWLIRSAGSGKYIAFDGEAKDGAPIVAVDEPSQRWDIWPEEGVSQGFRHGQQPISLPSPAKVLTGSVSMARTSPSTCQTMATRPPELL
ncbi:hypothetical protein BC834DRAFT_844475 [Gloeopeniophorella convolvens]|nr:hypothetical protein BC834DRAFT_844475 [Gloeopeniophorella convolvens]